MTATHLDVVGIGNALVDVLSKTDDAFLEAHQVPKGSMTLIDQARAEELYGAMGPAVEVSGGSAGTAVGDWTNSKAPTWGNHRKLLEMEIKKHVEHIDSLYI